MFSPNKKIIIKDCFPPNFFFKINESEKMVKVLDYTG